MLAILGLLTGLAGPIATLVGKILDLQAAKANAASDKERAQIDREIQETEARKAVLVAEAGSRIGSATNTLSRTFLMLPAALILWKFAYDRVVGPFYGCSGRAASGLEECGRFVTDKLSTEEWAIVASVIAFYFVSNMFKRK